MWFDNSMEDSIVSINKNIKSVQLENDKIEQRKANITSLNKFLQNENEDKNLIESYYPEIRKEEDVISKINQIAFSTGVYVSEMNINYGNDASEEKINKSLAIPKYISITEISPKNSTEIVAVGIPTEKNILSKLVTVELKIYGNYDQIKGFLNTLYPIGLLSNIESFEIKKDSSNQKKAEDNNDENSSTLLSSNIVINFGYLKKGNAKLSDLLESPTIESDRFDFSIVDKFKDLLLEKYSNSEIGEVGESNPFFP